jgi:hypothetical protein
MTPSASSKLHTYENPSLQEEGFFVRMTPYRHHTSVWAEFTHTLPIQYAACECTCPHKVAHVSALPRHTLKLEYARIEISEMDLHHQLFSTPLHKEILTDCHISLNNGLLLFSGTLQQQGKWIPFCIEAKPVVSGPGEITVLFLDEKFYGVPSEPAPMLLNTLWQNLGGAHTHKACLSSWTFKPFELLCKNVFPRMGWKIPQHTQAPYIHLTCDQGFLRIECSSSAQALPPLAASLKQEIETFKPLEKVDSAQQNRTPEEAYQLFSQALAENPLNPHLQRRFLQTAPLWNIHTQASVEYAHTLLFNPQQRAHAYMALLTWALRDQQYAYAEMLCLELLSLRELSHNPYHIAHMRQLLQKIGSFITEDPPRKTSSLYDESSISLEDISEHIRNNDFSQALKALYRHTLHDPNNTLLHTQGLALFKKCRAHHTLRIPYYTLLGILVSDPSQACAFTLEAAHLAYTQNNNLLQAQDILRSFLLRGDVSKDSPPLQQALQTYQLTHDTYTSLSEIPFHPPRHEERPSLNIHQPESLHQNALYEETHTLELDKAFLYFSAERLWRSPDTHAEQLIQSARNIKTIPPVLTEPSLLTPHVFHQGVWGVLYDFAIPLARILEWCHTQQQPSIKTQDETLPKHHPVQAFLKPVFNLFNLPDTPVLHRASSSHECLLDVSQNTPHLILTTPFLTPPTQTFLPFLTARLLARYHYGFALCGETDTDSLKTLLDATAHVLCHAETAHQNMHAGSAFSRIVKILHNKIPTHVASAAGTFAHLYISERHALDFAAWRSACIQSADRLALVYTSDPEEALRALYLVSQHNPQQHFTQWLREDPYASSLYQYALSEQHFKARELCGVAIERDQ